MKLIVVLLLLGATPREVTVLGKTVRILSSCALKQEKAESGTLDCGETALSWVKLEKPWDPKLVDQIADSMGKKVKVLKLESPGCTIAGRPAVCRRLVAQLPSGPLVTHFGVVEEQGATVLVRCTYAESVGALPAVCAQLFGPKA